MTNHSQTKWQTKKLQDISDVFIDGDWIEKKDQSSSGIRLVQTGNIGVGTFKNKVEYSRYISQDTFKRLRCTEIFTGDILISRLPDPVGRSCIIPSSTERMITAVDCTIIRLDTSKIIPEFLNYYTQSQSYLNSINTLTTGTTRSRISRKNLGEVTILYPSIQEQKRIVKILDEAFEKIDKAIENVEKNIQNSRLLFESHLNSVFSNSGNDWEEKKLEDIGKVSMCRRIFKEQTSKSGDIPFYKIGTFGKKADAFISNKIYNEFREKFSFPKKGDILLSASGTIGRRVRYDGEPAYFQDSNIVWIDNDEKQILNDYLYHFYGACNWNSTNGATISRLYNSNLKQIKIKFPKSFQEQVQIVKELDKLLEQTKKLEENYKIKLTNLKELKKSILNKAFAGEL